MNGRLIPRGRRPLGAHVTGYAAVWAYTLLVKAADQSIQHHTAAGRLDIAQEIAGTMADLREAVIQYQGATDPGNTETVTGPTPEVSEPLGSRSPGFLVEVDVHAAADRLGVTERRVRQLLGSGALTGRRDRSRWSVNVEDLDRLIADRSVTT